MPSNAVIPNRFSGEGSAFAVAFSFVGALLAAPAPCNQNQNQNAYHILYSPQSPIFLPLRRAIAYNRGLF
jgi:hypothetical protein